MRTALFGTKSSQMSVDFPLDILFARHLITDSQRRAGYEYMRVRWHIFGAPVGKSGAYSDTISRGSLSGPPPSDEDQTRRDERTRTRYDGIVLALQSRGRRIVSAVDNAAIYLRVPRAILADGNARSVDRKELEEIKEGLATIAQWLGYEEKKTQKAA